MRSIGYNVDTTQQSALSPRTQAARALWDPPCNLESQPSYARRCHVAEGFCTPRKYGRLTFDGNTQLEQGPGRQTD